MQVAAALGNASLNLAEVDAPLSLREMEVLELLSFGHTTDEVGIQMYISPHTVKSHCRGILTKLGVFSRAGAVRAGFERGVLTTSTLSEKGRPTFTDRHKEIFMLLSYGFTDSSIGSALGLSVETIKSHLKKIKRDTDALSRAHMVRIGFEQGILSDQDSLEEFLKTHEAQKKDFWNHVKPGKE